MVNIKTKYKNLKHKSKIKNIFVFLTCILAFLTAIRHPRYGLCDILRLKENPKGKEGSKVEILEEREDSFIIKVPKDEIEVIKKKRPTDVELWKEKKILWEDQGDYIAIFLPKERVTIPEGGEDYKEGAYFGRGKTEALKSLISSAGAEPAYQAGAFAAQGKGMVTGKVLAEGKPVFGCKVKIVYIKGQTNLFSKLFGGAAKDQGESADDIVFETETDEKGLYAFTGVPLGDYDIYWLPRNGKAWIRKLSEKPSITVLPGKTVQFEDINLR